MAGDTSARDPVRAPVPDGLVVVLDALAARFGGTAYAAVQLAEALARNPRVGRVVVIAQRSSIVGSANWRHAAITAATPEAPASRAELAWRIGWESLRLPALVVSTRADVLISFSGMLPVRPSCPVICLLANPVPYERTGRLGDRLRRRAISRTRRYAAATYVPSTQMQRLVGGPPARVVPLGVDRTAFLPPEGPGTDLLYVADFYRHKRHDLVIAAWESLPEPRPRLRLIGNPAVDPRTYAEVASSAADPRISVEPQLPFAMLLDAYRGARAVVVASEHESFSMPLAEAVASGIPAVIRDDPVLRETGGPGALVVPEATPEAWAETLDRILHDDDLHLRLSRAGLEHSKRFSWDAMAETVVTDTLRVRP